MQRFFDIVANLNRIRHDFDINNFKPRMQRPYKRQMLIKK